jgi:hypothetical protein
MNLNQFTQLLQETSRPLDSPPLNSTHSHSPSFHQQRNHHYWETESVPDQRDDRDRQVWESQDYSLNPNRISVRSDDILHNPRSDPPPQVKLGAGFPPSWRDQHKSQPLPPPAMTLQIPQSLGSPNLSASQPNRKTLLGSESLQQGRPPLHQSSNDFQRESSSKLEDPKLERRFPAPPSELGVLMRVILEGWLEKKSSKLGIWQKVPSVSLCLSLSVFLSLI